MKSRFFTIGIALICGTSLLAQENYVVGLNMELQNNKELIHEYKQEIAKLEARNRYLLDQKKLHPKLYQQLPTYESTKKAYIYRIKLNGAKPQNINFRIKDKVLSIEMNMQKHNNGKNGYFESSQYFYRSFTLPSNVKERDITHKIVGDYFVIRMPKK
jgi:HSP20 family molecular chaperone IbpA